MFGSCRPATGVRQHLWGERAEADLLHHLGRQRAVIVVHQLDRQHMIMMTDGENNDNYDTGSPPHRTSQNGVWDTAVVTAATTLEAGPNTTIPEDDVEIYVINLQCDNSNTFSNGGCTSKLASRAPGDHLCPGPMPVAGDLSNTDTVLIATSSSKTGTCDHYYPLRRTENLPGLFLQLAGTISRGALTE